MVNGGRVSEENKIEPTATAAASSGDTDLAADGLKLLANLVDLLGGEWAATNSGLVSLDDTDNFLQLEGREGETGKDTTNASVGRSNHGVSAPVNVESQSVGSLDEHGSVVLLRVLDQRNLVNDKLCQARAPFVVSLDLSLDIVLEQVAVALLVGGGHGPELVVHELLVEDFSNSDTGASGLGLVARADTLLGGADGALAELNLLEAVDERVQLEQRVSAVADEDAVLGAQAVLLQLLQLMEELRNADNSGGTNEVDGLGVDQTGRQDVEVVGDAVDDDGVAGIVTTG